MKPVYRKVSRHVEFCSVCNEELKGNNSLAFPWRCACGTWISSSADPSEFRLATPEEKGIDTGGLANKMSINKHRGYVLPSGEMYCEKCHKTFRDITLVSGCEASDA